MDLGLPVGVNQERAHLCLSPTNSCSSIYGLQSLWDNPEFIQAGFHIRRFITAVVDTEADRENIKALYSSLKSTLVQIDVSALKPPYYTFSAWI
jgi:hypothetical protein